MPIKPNTSFWPFFPLTLSSSTFFLLQPLPTIPFAVGSAYLPLSPDSVSLTTGHGMPGCLDPALTDSSWYWRSGGEEACGSPLPCPLLSVLSLGAAWPAVWAGDTVWPLLHLLLFFVLLKEMRRVTKALPSSIGAVPSDFMVCGKIIFLVITLFKMRFSPQSL